MDKGGDDTIVAEFEGRSVEDNDFFSIRQFLVSYLLHLSPTNEHIYALVENIIRNGDRASVISLVDDEESESEDQSAKEPRSIFALAAVVVVNELLHVTELLKTFLQSHTEDDAITEKVINAFNNPTLGWILHPRLINLPAEAALPLHKALYTDIGNDFSTFILVSTAHELLPIERSAKRSRITVDRENELFFLFPEDECYYEECEFCLRIPVDTSVDNEEETGTRTVVIAMVINANRIPSVLEHMEKMFR